MAKSKRKDDQAAVDQASDDFRKAQERAAEAEKALQDNADASKTDELHKAADDAAADVEAAKAKMDAAAQQLAGDPPEDEAEKNPEPAPELAVVSGAAAGMGDDTRAGMRDDYDSHQDDHAAHEAELAERAPFVATKEWVRRELALIEQRQSEETRRQLNP